MPCDIEKMNKLPVEARFFDVNQLWYFMNRWVVRLLYPTSVTPNQITFLSLVFGLVSAGFYVSEIPNALVWGAVFLYGKVFLDNVDGNLARVRGTTSRFGRFLDSLADFLVTVLVYFAVTIVLVRNTGMPEYWVLGLLGLAVCFLQSTFFVFYLVNYTSRVGSYEKNRVDESVTEEDRRGVEEGQTDPWDLRLQSLFVWVYGWQDKAVEQLDAFCRSLARVDDTEEALKNWYSDRKFLAWISPLCLCTNNVMLVIFSLLNQLELFMVLLVSLMNLYVLGFLIWKVWTCRQPSSH
ncbi:MAG: CDP-alcohol phosphatidyltransferase family protein [Nitrospina sp.]|jgi:phosphatidylglycerophosphate synthase|nr:CDP-alcohol phosphatidyltransferase family protein [Nitrospina sp.]MBT3508897.1 CDP-alcohol phosphatidyltransferase family protein [Nitrospina sp.]MBT4047953.1 CDP-alcohol phosphatidyltransferase family protein [Nitrospina sp.]MBT4558861.1 CDP-alcohol phosphatidyltransferase family protein [Nitrospina sp.]MBT5651035.1 CDP-alcohol phosphatidyltransferase family protein [Nitrospina sp.]